MARGRRARVETQRTSENSRVEYIDPHRRQYSAASAARKLGTRSRFFDEPIDSAVAVDCQDAELSRVLGRHFDAADRHGPAAFAVLLEHRPVIHAVDVVSGQYQHEPAVERLDGRQIAIHRVGGAAIADAWRAR